MQAMSGLDQLQPVEGMGPIGEVRLVPDLDTFRVLPYAPRTGALLVDLVGLDGEAAPQCPRSFLKRMIAWLDKRGLTLEVAFENEFSLATRSDDGFTPVDSSLCFSTIGMTASQDYVDDLVDALDEQALPLEQYYAELGHGQQEISTAARARPARRRRAGARARDDPRRRGRARAGRLARAEAVARRGRQRLPHPLLALGRVSATASTTPRGPTASRTTHAPSSRASSSTCPACAA